MSHFSWDSPTFGSPATCVHEAENGSWVGVEREEDQ